MQDAKHEGLRAAAEVLARIMRVVAAVKTNETARQVHVDFGAPYVAVVSAGYAVGAYGWNPIQALMFDNNKRHPLFGDMSHWYHQGYYPITEETLRLGADEAVEAFADTALPILFKDNGFK